MVDSRFSASRRASCLCFSSSVAATLGSAMFSACSARACAVRSVMPAAAGAALRLASPTRRLDTGEAELLPPRVSTEGSLWLGSMPLVSSSTSMVARRCAISASRVRSCRAVKLSPSTAVRGIREARGLAVAVLRAEDDAAVAGRPEAAALPAAPREPPVAVPGRLLPGPAFFLAEGDAAAAAGARVLCVAIAGPSLGGGPACGGGERADVRLCISFLASCAAREVRMGIERER